MAPDLSPLSAEPTRTADSQSKHDGGRSGATGQAEKLAALHDQLAEQVAELRSSEGWRRWLDVAARFHNYSFGNTVLILAQRPDATLVAGYESWKSFGRQVSRGERGIQILAPVIRRRDHVSDPGKGSGLERTHTLDQHITGPPPSTESRSALAGGLDETPSPYVVAGFRVTYVWDVAQTTGTPLPESPRPTLLGGEAPPGLWDALADAVDRSGYRLERGPCPKGANGVTDSLARTVTVRSDVDDAQAVKTLAHELAHVRLHAGAALDYGVACRGAVEVEAESVAYLVSAAHGLDTSTYTFPYVATWADQVVSASAGTHQGRAPQDVVRATAERVLTAAHGILQDVELAAVTLQRAQDLEARLRSAQIEDLAGRVSAGVVRATTARVRSTSCDRQPANDHRDAARRSGHDDEGLAHTSVDRDRLVAINNEALLHFIEHAGDSWVPEYLEQRRLGAALEAPWGAGYASRRWTFLVDELRDRGYTDDEMLAAGLVIRARTGNLVDRFRDRLVLPFADAQGEVVGFIGRAHPDADTERSPKYMNSPTTAIFSKGDHLYGLGPAVPLLQQGARPVLVEGPLDAIAVTTGTGGRCVGLAPSGTALTTRQVDLVARHVDLARRALTVAFDSDPAGERAAEAALHRLAVTGTDPRVALFGNHKDPSEYLVRQGSEALVRALVEDARPLSDRVLNRQLSSLLLDGGGPLSGQDLRTLGSAVAALPPATALRQADRVAARLGIDVSRLRNAVLEALVLPVRTDTRTFPRPK